MTRKDFFNILGLGAIAAVLPKQSKALVDYSEDETVIQFDNNITRCSHYVSQDETSLYFIKEKYNPNTDTWIPTSNVDGLKKLDSTKITVSNELKI